jgi:hypothetical protein
MITVKDGKLNMEENTKCEVITYEVAVKRGYDELLIYKNDGSIEWSDLDSVDTLFNESDSDYAEKGVVYAFAVKTAAVITDINNIAGGIDQMSDEILVNSNNEPVIVVIYKNDIYELMYKKKLVK